MRQVAFSSGMRSSWHLGPMLGMGRDCGMASVSPRLVTRGHRTRYVRYDIPARSVSCAIGCATSNRLRHNRSGPGEMHSHNAQRLVRKNAERTPGPASWTPGVSSGPPLSHPSRTLPDEADARVGNRTRQSFCRMRPECARAPPMTTHCRLIEPRPASSRAVLPSGEGIRTASAWPTSRKRRLVGRVSVCPASGVAANDSRATRTQRDMGQSRGVLLGRCSRHLEQTCRRSCSPVEPGTTGFSWIDSTVCDSTMPLPK